MLLLLRWQQSPPRPPSQTATRTTRAITCPSHTHTHDRSTWRVRNRLFRIKNRGAAECGAANTPRAGRVRRGRQEGQVRSAWVIVPDGKRVVAPPAGPAARSHAHRETHTQTHTRARARMLISCCWARSQQPQYRHLAANMAARRGAGWQRRAAGGNGDGNVARL